MNHFTFFKILFLFFPHNQGTMSEMNYSSRLSWSSQSAQSSSRAKIHLRGLDTSKSPSTLNESRGEINEMERGMSRAKSSYNDSHVRARCNFNYITDNSSADNCRNVNREAKEGDQQPLTPSTTWRAEARDNVTQKALLRPHWKPVKK